MAFKETCVGLKSQLVILDKTTDWKKVAEECSIEKQIEIRAEIVRAIKRLDKEGRCK